MAIYKTLHLPNGATVYLDDAAFANCTKEELDARRRNRDRVAYQILVSSMSRKAEEARNKAQ